MMEGKHRLDELFDSARSQAPLRSFDDMQKTFMAATAGAVTGITLVKFLTSLKGIIMVSTVGVIITVAAVSIWPSEEVNDKEVNQSQEVVNETTEGDAHPEMNDKTVVIELVSDGENNRTFRTYSEGEWKEGDSAEIVEELREVEGIPEFAIPQNDENEKQQEPMVSDEPEAEPELVMFLLTSQSEDQDFENVKVAAEKVGIKFWYDLKRKRGEIKRCTIHMSIIFDEEEGKRCSHTSKITGNFSKSFGWKLDESGKPIELISD